MALVQSQIRPSLAGRIVAAVLSLALTAHGPGARAAATEDGSDLHTRRIVVNVTDSGGAPLRFAAEAVLENGSMARARADGSCEIELGDSRRARRLEIRTADHRWTLFDVPAAQVVHAVRPGHAAAAPAAPPAIQHGRAGFEEMGAAAGVDTRDDTSGVIWEDFDGDGDLDLLCVGGHRDSVIGLDFPDNLFRNDGDGTFTNITTIAGLSDLAEARGASVGDFDNDGDADIFIANGDGTGSPEASNLYRNGGRGTFTDIAAQAGVAAPAANGHGAEFFDLDRDGDLDLYLVSMNFDGNALFRNRGNGTFADITARAAVSGGGFGRDVAILDYDRDGWPDIYVVNSQDPNRLYRNDRDGTFTDVSTEAGVDLALTGRSVAVVDFNNDSWFDLFVTNVPSFEPNALFRNNGNGTFTDVAAEAGVDQIGFQVFSTSSAFGDADSDGRQDLIITSSDTFYLERADETFSDETALSGVVPQAWGQGAAFGDYDQDGRLDLYLARADFGPSDLPNALYRNVGSPGRALAVRLEGVLSNRSAVGAVVRVETAEGRQWRYRTAGDAHGSANDGVAWFGLGGGPQARSVFVQWPSGLTQEHSRLGDKPVVDVIETGIQLVPPGKHDWSWRARIVGPPGSEVVLLRSYAPGRYDGPPFGGRPFDGTLRLDWHRSEIIAHLVLGEEGRALVDLPIFGGPDFELEDYFQALVGSDIAGGKAGLTNLLVVDLFPW